MPPKTRGTAKRATAKKKGKPQHTRTRKKASTPPASPTPPPYSDITDPTLIDRPDPDLVDPALSRAWKVNGNRQMCVIFDCVNPVRQFKRGTTYNPEDKTAFPDYDPSPELDGNVTESDEEADLQPYNPIIP